MIAYVHLLLVLVVLLGLNELFRRSKWTTLVFYIVLPLVLTITLWSKTATVEGSSTNTWFHWVKLYSVIAAVLGFTYMRYSKKELNRFFKSFPALILAVNIAEAVLRDFELGAANGGSWHYLNGVAGILSIITISGWSRIFIEKNKKRDLLWPDMTVGWIIAYDIWNFAYIYNCVPEHASYGIVVLLACTLPSLFIKKGTWIQARAFTLAAWMIYIFTFTHWIDTPGHTVALPDNPALLMAISILSIAANIAFSMYHFSKMRKGKTYKFGAEVYA